MAIDRDPVFELHIAPLFRLIDRVHMMKLPPERRVDLADYQQVRAKHTKILTMLQSAGTPMPTNDTGGRWPEEWITLFKRWGDTGFGKLTRPPANNLALSLIGADRYMLACTVQVPGPASSAWFDITDATPENQTYELVMREDLSAGGQPLTLEVEERIRGPLNVGGITVRVEGVDRQVAVPIS